MPRLVSCLIAVILFLPLSGYSTPSATPDQLAWEILDKSGILLQTANFPRAVHAALDQNRSQIGGVSDDHLEKIKQLISRAFDTEKMQRILQQLFVEQLSVDEMRELTVWLDSPLGKKISDLEKQSSGPEAYKKIEEYAAGNQGTESLSGRRIELINELEQEVNGTTLTVDMAINNQVMLFSAILAVTGSPVPPEQLRQEVEKNRFEIEGLVTNEVLLSMRYIYKELTDDELRQYIAFTRSSTGKKFVQLVLQGFNTVFLQASRDVGKSINTDHPAAQ